MSVRRQSVAGTAVHSALPSSPGAGIILVQKDGGRRLGTGLGIFVIAQPDVTLKVLRKHFRALLRVIDEQKRVLIFRFYDPRVLRIYLPTCTGLELSTFFGPVRAFACENAAGDDLIRYQRSQLLFGGLSLMGTPGQATQLPVPIINA
jgi:hypothetical protein